MTFTRNVAVGRFNACMMLSDAGDFRVSWSPSIPASLDAAQLAAYMHGRNVLSAHMRGPHGLTIKS